MRLLYPALLACLAGAVQPEAHAAPTWLTLVGDPQDQAGDYVQFDPRGLARKNGVPTLPVRVSRARARSSQEGLVFRSFEAVVAVHCKDQTARFLRASFYAAPDFQGIPFKAVVFEPSDVRPMAFREIKGEPTQRLMRAACNTVVQTLDPQVKSEGEPPPQEGNTPGSAAATGGNPQRGDRRDFPAMP